MTKNAKSNFEHYIAFNLLFDDTYLSIQKNSEGFFKDRGSKFISFAFPVLNEQQIKEIIQNLKKEHHTARHHCYAWRLGADKQAYRANDDGEPSNTAGKPILAQIQSHDLTDILIVVVRYFGGTLLGVGGLINAYREASADTIKNAVIIEKHIHLHFEIDFSFQHLNEVMKQLKQFDCKIDKQEFETSCSIQFSLRKSLSETCEAKLKKIAGLNLKYI